MDNEYTVHTFKYLICPGNVAWPVQNAHNAIFICIEYTLVYMRIQ